MIKFSVCIILLNFIGKNKYYLIKLINIEKIWILFWRLVILFNWKFLYFYYWKNILKYWNFVSILEFENEWKSFKNLIIVINS